MDPNHLQELIDLEEGYWWHVAKRRLVVDLLHRYFPPPGLLVEGGVGSGRNLLEFQRLGYRVSGFDLMPESVANARSRGLSGVHVHDLADPWPVEPGSTRVAVMLDVLEHIADPVAVLKHAADAIGDDGGILLSVPAYPSLFCDWDRQLGHFRRYTRDELLRQVREASLQVIWLGHWNAFSLPAAWLSRGIGPQRQRTNGATFPRLPSIVNRFLIGCAAVERRVLRWAGMPVGLSLVAVLGK
jgi:SAM-dependent methyltransferase